MTFMTPELLVIATAFIILILDFTFLEGEKSWLSWLSVGGLILSLAFAVPMLGQTGDALGGQFRLDSLGAWFKIILLLATLLSICFLGVINSRGEFLSVLLFSLSGMMFLVSSRNLVSFYVSLELATVPLFALTAWTRTDRSGEGAMKYLAVGALASALLLYGFALLYGLTGEVQIDAMAKALQPSGAVYLAAALILAGIGFKLTLFPFHMWAPDAYEAAPIPVTAFLSSASKTVGLILAFTVLYRLFLAFLPGWAGFVAAFATATMTLGNLVAVLQKNLKRFMAFSAISQAGYLILGFLGVTGPFVTSMVFYMFVYVLTNLAAFGVIILHVQQTGKEDIDSLKGMSIKNPILALVLMIALFGLAGIPPLAGFVGKFFLFNAAAKAGYYWLVLVAAVNSTVSLYYYLRLVRQMYIEAPDNTVPKLKLSLLSTLGLAVATAGTVVCGLLPIFYETIERDAFAFVASLVTF